LSRVVDDITGATLAPTELARLRAAVECCELPAVDPSLRIGAPPARPGKIVCIGLSYRDHAVETGDHAPRVRTRQDGM
jgi:2-keto-4-pentenoate hydratase/2-oxohepta-3-ene-1,7-dioic acid hydratase in catechol pathway